MAANRSKPRNPVVWQGFQTVGLMIEHKVTVDAHCTPCGHTWKLDLQEIATKRGPYYSLIGRRVRCRRGHYAAILAHAPGRPALPIHFSVAAEWDETARLRNRCGWCGKGAHG